MHGTTDKISRAVTATGWQSRDYFKTAKGGTTGPGRTSPGALNPLTCYLQHSFNLLQKWFKLHFNTVEVCVSLQLDSKICERAFRCSCLASFLFMTQFIPSCSLLSTVHWFLSSPSFPFAALMPLQQAAISLPSLPLSLCLAGGGKLFQLLIKQTQGCCDHLHSPALHLLGYEFIS